MRAGLNRQLGLSMISLLIGLMLGLLSTVAAMALFRTVVQNAVGAQDNLAQDSVVSSGLLTAQLEVQKAGYGVESDTNNCTAISTASPEPSGTANVDLVMYSGAAMSGVRVTGTTVSIDPVQKTGNALLWRWHEAGADRCAGLVAENGGLQFLERANCPGLATAGTIDWTVTPLIPDGRLQGGDAVAFGARSDLCWPYGKREVPDKGVVLTLAAGNSSAALQSEYTVCLPNVCR